MAKHLYVGNYVFDPELSRIILPDRVQTERLLLVTNVTDGTIIYNFADPQKGVIANFFDIETEKTQIEFEFDCTSMSATDKIQIFIEKENTPMEPAEDMLDPVGKLRVSNPENLIDTDFEYGLQGTKWETIQTINNIPTVYSNAGDTPLDNITSVTCQENSKDIKVVTGLPHGLSIGDPISVQGVDLSTSEGFFIVTSVPSATEFFYTLDLPSNKSGDISGGYTNIVAGKFFEGSTLPISTSDGAQTDGGDSASTITVTTTETHGFQPGTKVYVRNTVGPKELIIDSAADPSAPDGRPFVDTVQSFNISNTVDMSTSTGRGGLRDRTVIPWDWESTFVRYLDAGDVDVATDRITWTSHGMFDRYALLFNTPAYQGTDIGLTDGQVYYVEVIDVNTIKLHTTTALSSAVNLTTYNGTYGKPRIGLVYKVESANGTNRSTAFTLNGTGGGSFTLQNSSRMNFSGSGTQADPFAATSANQGLRNTTAFVQYLNTSSGTMFWNHSVSSEQNFDFSRIRINGVVVSSISGINSASGSTFIGVNQSFQYEYRKDGSVNRFNDQGTLVSAYNNAAGAGAADSEYSGSDLVSNQFGLGNTQPSRIIAFQGRSLNSYFNSNDAFSYLANQRQVGRYGTISPFYNQQWVSTNQINGSFDLNYSDNSVNYGSGSEIYYIFTRDLQADNNTFFIEDHGINEGETVTVTVDPTAYSAGERFIFASSTGATTTQSNVFTGVASVVTQDLFRVQTNDTPNTGDIVKVPTDFTIAFTRDNDLFNTIFVANHKVQADVLSVYSVDSGVDGATSLGGLDNGDDIVLTRVSDSRLSLSVGTAAAPFPASPAVSIQHDTAAYPVRSNSNASGQVFNIGVSDRAGVSTPINSVFINSLDFRGDFAGSNEYVDFFFNAENINYRIGAFDDQGDTAIYTTSTTFPAGGTPKNITSFLTDIGGGVQGFQVTVDPSPAVNFTGGGAFPWWEFRFSFSGTGGATSGLSGPGSGRQVFNVPALVGAYDGIFEISSVPGNKQFKIQSDFTIPIREYPFTPSEISAGDDTITFTDRHNFVTGEQVSYESSGNGSIVPTGTDVDDLFVIAVNSSQIKLASSASSALANAAIDISSVSGTHKIKSSNIIKLIRSPGKITTVSGDLTVTGDSASKFLSNFKRFDKVYIDNGTFIEELTVNRLTTDTKMTLFTAPDFVVSGSEYFYQTQITPRPDGFNLHKPFDGGVDITAGTSPNSKITRQTRKYFRYQSGKGIQNSYAINFNPPKIVASLITSSGTSATVITQEPHYFSVGNGVIIAGATVTTGVNTYNGTFTVSEVVDDFTFRYDMGATPSDVSAGGFSTYVSTGWTDSFVRAGMFDDQNGFFYEFDGQDLFAVRRSSTIQLAGTITATRGSQVITGSQTNFVGQLTVGNMIVVRGQSYKVVEISANNRIVVQPAYRGIDSTRVKATKTVDTRTRRSDFNKDPIDGTGKFGYDFDATKIQMAYHDYSWYGAGKIRYGFKDQNGHIKYVHEYKHNNKLDESYFRSGNLPGRYEIENGNTPTRSPTLFHFGTSVIMDGTFDDDKAFQFTANSRPFAFTNGNSITVTSTGASTFQQITLNGLRVFVHAIQVAQASAESVTIGDQIAGTNIDADSFITQVILDGANSLIFTNTPATGADPTGVTDVVPISTVLTLGESTRIDLTRPLPLISIRLAPSVDSSLTGAVGERAIINRMQLALRSAGVTINQACELSIILNPLPSTLNFIKAPAPSLTEIIRHRAGDSLLNGTTIFFTKVASGSTDVDISALIELGNSINGGDSIFPEGPDLLTVAIQPSDTSKVDYAAPFTVSGKISYSESQA